VFPVVQGLVFAFDFDFDFLLLTLKTNSAS
jgi:hypothetical protein